MAIKKKRFVNKIASGKFDKKIHPIGFRELHSLTSGIEILKNWVRIKKPA